MRMLFAAATLSMASLGGGAHAHAQAMMAEMATGGDPALTIAQNVAASPVHASLATSLDAAGLTETLSGTGPYTLLAPTDDAFAALEAGLLDTMLLPENKEALAGVLLCHVVDGALVTGDLAQMTADGTAGPEGVEIETRDGCVLTVQATPEGGVTVTDERGAVARVAVPDIMQANGVVHVLDTVLKPAGM